MTDKRLAIFLASGFEECEALIICDVLRRANVACDLVSVTDSLAVTSSHNVTVVADKTLDEISFNSYDMIFLPGGIPGTPNLHECSELMDALKSFKREGKFLGAICAAPSILAEEGLLDGVRATSNPGFQHVLDEKGAQLQKDAPVVVDNKFVTSQGMGTALDCAYEILHVLDPEYDLDDMKAKVVDLRK